MQVPGRTVKSMTPAEGVGLAINGGESDSGLRFGRRSDAEEQELSERVWRERLGRGTAFRGCHSHDTRTNNTSRAVRKQFWGRERTDRRVGGSPGCPTCCSALLQRARSKMIWGDRTMCSVSKLGAGG